MSREQLNGLLSEIRETREQALAELNDLTEAEFGLSTPPKAWLWDTLLLVLLRFGDHMRQHATHLRGTRETIGRSPTQPQRILAEAEIAWGILLAATVGLADEDLDVAPSDEGWTVRRILEHVRNAEEDYLEAIRLARSGEGETS